MPTITGIAHVELSVRDLEASAAWYIALLDLRRVFDERQAGLGITACALLHPASGVVLALTQHDRAETDPFDPRRAGLDHVSFAVADRAELRAWQERLLALGIDHTPLEEWSHGAAVTARDPDGIALEFYVRGPAAVA